MLALCPDNSLAFLERQKTYRFKLRKRYKELKILSLYNDGFLAFSKWQMLPLCNVNILVFLEWQKTPIQTEETLQKVEYMVVI